MDLHALMIVQSNTCTSPTDRYKFDDVFRKYYGTYSTLEIRATFDFLGNKNILPHTVLNILYAQMFETELNEEDLDDDDELCDLLSVAACVLAKKIRGSPVSRQRLNWQSHVQQLLKEGTFRAMYRMRHESFCELVHLLSPLLLVNIKQGRNRNRGGDHVYVELIVHVMLRYMAGGSFHNIRVTAGVATSPFFSCLHRGIRAVNSCPELAIKFPTLESDLNLLHLHLELKAMVVCSTDALQPLMAGCVELRCLPCMTQ
jgi:hypothetical protein